jgi:hypothetical protein
MDAALSLRSSSSRPPLRLGILIDTKVLPACLSEALDHVLHSNFAQLALVVYNGSAPRGAADKPPSGEFLFRLYERWDTRHASEAEDPVRPVDCTAALNGVESMTVAPVANDGVLELPEGAVRTIREKNIDVLIRLGFDGLAGSTGKAARHGMWFYEFSDDAHRGGPAYFWEVYENTIVSGAALLASSGGPEGERVLCRGFFSTSAGVSWARNRVQPYWGSSTFLIQKLRQLHEHGWDCVESQMDPMAPRTHRNYSVPSNAQMLRWFGPLAAGAFARRARSVARGQVFPHWTLAVNPGKRSGIGSRSSADLSAFEWIDAPRGHFYADPFLIKHLDKPWVFFEDYDYSTQKGAIVCAEVIEDGRLSKTIPALERPYHLSYPCVFYDRGALYMIPESLANGTVDLYRCLRFPDVWEPVKTLLHAPAVDTTVWIEDGKYWFFVTLQERRAAGLQLWLFHSNALDGEWISHPWNPISTDVRSSRGGGAIYRRDGELIRPSQDCSGNYGRRFDLNEITVLNTAEYRERPCASVEADGLRDMVGTHTYTRLDHIEMIDGCAFLPARRVLAR